MVIAPIFTPVFVLIQDSGKTAAQIGILAHEQYD